MLENTISIAPNVTNSNLEKHEERPDVIIIRSDEEEEDINEEQAWNEESERREWGSARDTAGK